jgi:large subunit ribosomal protein L25
MSGASIPRNLREWSPQHPPSFICISVNHPSCLSSRHNILLNRLVIISKMAASQGQYVALAKQLPPRLTRFLARFPPPSILSEAQKSSSSSSAAAAAATATTITTALDTSSSDANATSEETRSALPPLKSSFPNPFLPQRHPITQKLHDPQFSLRRQAELVKLARDHGIEELLPFTVKKTAERGRAREENGLRVKGTGVGQRVKGKRWERTLKGRLEKRRQAMLGMPRLVEEWKEVSLSFFTLHVGVDADWGVLERSWSRVEEVAKVGRGLDIVVMFVYTTCLLSSRQNGLFLNHIDISDDSDTVGVLETLRFLGLGMEGTASRQSFWTRTSSLLGHSNVLIPKTRREHLLVHSMRILKNWI